MSEIPELAPGQHQILEETDVAFDPANQHLDLSKEEKRRTTALMMAIQAYNQLIIKEAEYLTVVADLARRNEGPALHPATIDAIVDAAIKFDHFISGGYPPPQPAGEEKKNEGRAKATNVTES